VPLDAESRALLDTTLAAERARPGMSAAELRAQALRLGRELQGEAPPIARVFDESIASCRGALKLRVYDPQTDAGAGCLVWLHGGGFTTGGLDTHDTLCRRLAGLSAQVVVSVDYRLAPEHPFPAALDDSCAAIAWVAERSRRLGAASGRLAVGGSSAGGNLATSAALRLRDEGSPALALQALVYPALDATMSLSRRSAHAMGYQLTSAMMAGYWAHYLGVAGDARDPRLSPFFAANLDGVPPAYVLTAQFDPLVHEIEVYAERLRQAGALAGLARYDGVMHGFFGQAGRLSKARAAQAELCARVRSAVSRTASPATPLG
jgi:acetyl esterase